MSEINRYTPEQIAVLLKQDYIDPSDKFVKNFYYEALLKERDEYKDSSMDYDLRLEETSIRLDNCVEEIQSLRKQLSESVPKEFLKKRIKFLSNPDEEEYSPEYSEGWENALLIMGEFIQNYKPEKRK